MCRCALTLLHPCKRFRMIWCRHENETVTAAISVIEGTVVSARGRHPLLRIWDSCLYPADSESELVCHGAVSPVLHRGVHVSDPVEQGYVDGTVTPSQPCTARLLS